MLTLPDIYLDRIDDLHQRVQSEIWITGGWALSAVLARKYVGDVDVITTASKEELMRAAESLSLSAYRSARGAIRIHFDDQNHLDISSATSYSDAGTIAEALDHFNFSANAIAINPFNGEQIRTSDNREDLDRCVFRVNKKYESKKRDQIGNYTKFDILQYFFNLTPGDDKKTVILESDRHAAKLDSTNVEPTFLLGAVADRASQATPPGCRSWLARGIVRAALTKTMTYWDDIDVIVECTAKELFLFLDRQNATYTVNFFGMPKVHLADGQKMDLIPVANSARVEQLLQSFPLRPDAVAWSIQEKRYFDPLGALADLGAGVVKLSDDFSTATSSSDKRYAALKAVFLLARYGMSADATVLRLVNSPQDFTLFDRRNAARLAMELLSFGIGGDNLEKYSWPGTSQISAIHLLQGFM